MNSSSQAINHLHLNRNLSNNVLTQHRHQTQLSIKWLAPWHRQQIRPDYNPYTIKNSIRISLNNPQSYWQENCSESTVGFTTERASIRRKSRFWRGVVLGTRKTDNTRSFSDHFQVNVGLPVGFTWCNGKIYRVSECPNDTQTGSEQVEYKK